jgi:hypothetical protein
MSKLIIDCKTGETVERELNAEEIAQQAIDEANSAEAQVLIKAEVEAKETAKAAAEGKLAALGLTTSDLRALGL